MIDCRGKPVLVAYPEHHLIWIEAANSLSPFDRSRAFYDIAELTGRSVGAIRKKANEMRAEKIHADWLRNASLMTAKPFLGRIPKMVASDLKAPSLARLMGSR